MCYYTCKRCTVRTSLDCSTKLGIFLFYCPISLIYYYDFARSFSPGDLASLRLQYPPAPFVWCEGPKNNQISISHSKGIVFFRVFLCTQARLTASPILAFIYISISSPIGIQLVLWYNYFVVTIYEKYWRFSYGYY